MSASPYISPFPNDPHWNAVGLAISRSWNGAPFTRRDLDGFRLALGDQFSPEILLLGVRRLAVSGQKFYPRPDASQLGAECMRIARPDLTPVTWTEFWNEFLHAFRDPTVMGMSGTNRARAIAVGELVEARLRNTIAGSFAAMIYAEVATSSIQGPNGGAIVGSLAKRFEEHQSELRARAFRGGAVLRPSQVLARGAARTPRPLEPIAALPSLPGGSS